MVSQATPTRKKSSPLTLSLLVRVPDRHPLWAPRTLRTTQDPHHARIVRDGQHTVLGEAEPRHFRRPGGQRDPALLGRGRGKTRCAGRGAQHIHRREGIGVERVRVGAEEEISEARGLALAGLGLEVGDGDAVAVGGDGDRGAG